MGVGKTAVCGELMKLLQPAAWLDGDWCWRMEPFVVNDETKRMALDNMGDVLRRFLRCSVYETVLFSWVMPDAAIVREVLSRLSGEAFALRLFTLTAGESALEERLRGDIRAGMRTSDVLARSLAYLPRYGAPGGDTLDTTRLTAIQTAKIIAERLKTSPQGNFLENF